MARKLIAPEDVAWRAGSPGRWGRVERCSLAGPSTLGVPLVPKPEFGEGGGDTNVVLIHFLTSLPSLDHSVLLHGSERAVHVK